MTEPKSQRIAVDEESLRACILKAYHQAGDEPVSEQTIEALRQFLSGPPSGPSVPGRYYFEDHPEDSLVGLLKALDEIAADLSLVVFEPLLAAFAERRREGANQLAPNVNLFVASLAGPVSLRAGIGETAVDALLATAIIAISRLGSPCVEKYLKGTE